MTCDTRLDKVSAVLTICRLEALAVELPKSGACKVLLFCINLAVLIWATVRQLQLAVMQMGHHMVMQAVCFKADPDFAWHWYIADCIPSL